MRVLDTVTGVFCLINPRPKDRDSKPFKYAILSHTWDRKGEEQSYKQLKVIQKESRRSSDDVTDVDDEEQFVEDPLDDPTGNESPGPILIYPTISPKIQEACRVARQNGYRYLWIDFCCIDKTSISEVSESINSMYEWYALADVCYAFLADVPPTSAEQEHNTKDSRFRRSRWFTRGWTLPELIAPFNVVFLADDWSRIGSKFTLGKVIAEITNIDYDALLHIIALEEFSVAQRLSWGSRRETTRVEDRAYSLLGILDINMPTLYGEGDRAFRRLQEEIMRHTPDQSLFAWSAYGLLHSSSKTLPYNPETKDINNYVRNPLILDYDASNLRPSLLATSPDAFRSCEGIKSLSHAEVLRRLQFNAQNIPPRRYDFTPYGLHVELPVIHFDSSKYFLPRLLNSRESAGCPPFSKWYLVILGCEHRDFPGRLIGRVCYIQSLETNVDLLYTGFISHDAGIQSDLLPVSTETIRRLPSDSLGMKSLYIVQPPGRDKGVLSHPFHEPHEKFHLVLPKKTQDALSAQGYTVALEPFGSYDNPTTHLVTVIRNSDACTITISYHHSLMSNSLTIKADVTISEQGRQRVNLGSCLWSDFGPVWRGSLGSQDVALTGSRGLTLSLDLALFKTNYYCLSIELKTSTLSSSLGSQHFSRYR